MNQEEMDEVREVSLTPKQQAYQAAKAYKSKMVVMNEEINDLVDTTDVHTLAQRRLAVLELCEPDIEKQKQYFNKRPKAFYDVWNQTANTEQKIKTAGYGNNTTKNLTINVNGLGFNERQKLFDELSREVREAGEKMGYIKKGEKKEIEVSGEEVKPVSRIGELRYPS